MIRLLTNPRTFELAILVLFACATLASAAKFNAGKTLYYGGAFLLNLAVVFLMEGGK